MSKTLYTDLKTGNILSAHVSGHSHNLNKIEESLNLQTSSATITLNPVIDQDDKSLRYRIYEGSLRNWVSFTIKKNGEVIDNSLFESYPGFGAIVFNTPQTQSDKITATITYINSTSKRLNEIESAASAVATRVETLETSSGENATKVTQLMTDVDTIETEVIEMKADILELQQNGGGTTPGTGISSFGAPHFVAKGTYVSNNKPGYCRRVSAIEMAPSLCDCLPLPVSHTMTIDQMSMRVDTALGTTGTMAIYKDNGEGYPGALVVSGGTFSTATTGWKYNTISATLEPGMYWMVRNQDSKVCFAGWRYDDVITIGLKDFDSIPDDPTNQGSTRDFGFYGAYRLGTVDAGNNIGLNGTWPSTFPTGAYPIARVQYAAIFVRRSAT